MKHIVSAAMALILLAGCTPMEKIGLDWPRKNPDASTSAPEPALPEEAGAEDETLAGNDPEPAESTGFLGVSVASLGDPGREGFWIETPLVQSPAKGRVRYEKTGRTVKVDLIPIEGPTTAGSRLSLAAMRLLDAPLTGLPEVKIYRD